MSFTDLLIQTCTIEQKSLSTSGYEQIEDWAELATDVPCRKDTANNVKREDQGFEVNVDDDLFFFNPDVDISKGNRILIDSEYYEVLKVNKVLDSKAVHHIEVIGRNLNLGTPFASA